MVDVICGKLYRHFKGDLYLVENIGYDCETMKQVVIYRALYGDCKVFVRDYDSFTSKVDLKKYPLTKQKYRFELVDIESVKGCEDK